MLLEEQGPPAELKTIETPLLLSNTVYCNRLKPVERATSAYITSSAPREGVGPNFLGTACFSGTATGSAYIEERPGRFSLFFASVHL
jgi:hypothetical protein